METGKAKSTAEMNALLLCRDVQFLGVTKRVLKELAIKTTIDDHADSALARLADREFDSLIVDWRELDNMGAFLDAVRKSKSHRRCIVVAIVRDLLDAQQAFAAGVHFLIQKPASIVQIERCLRVARSSFVADRPEVSSRTSACRCIPHRQEHPSCACHDSQHRRRWCRSESESRLGEAPRQPRRAGRTEFPA